MEVSLQYLSEETQLSARFENLDRSSEALKQVLTQDTLRPLRMARQEWLRLLFQLKSWIGSETTKHTKGGDAERDLARAGHRAGGGKVGAARIDMVKFFPVSWIRGGTSAGILLFIVLASTARGQESDSTSEAWPEFDFFIKLNEKSRIFAMYSATKQESLGTYADGQTGVHIDFYGVRPLRRRIISYMDESRSKLLMLRAGYLFSRAKNNSGSSTEHMTTGEATGRAHLPAALLLSDRNRLDLRWVEGAPRHRYRNRLKLERTFKSGRFELTPYVHAEAFYDLRQRGWSRLRYAAGSEWAITKRIVLEGYFLRQNQWASVPQFVNAVGLAAQFYFR